MSSEKEVLEAIEKSSMTTKQKVVVGLAVLATGGVAIAAVFVLRRIKNKKVSNPKTQEETHE